MLKMRINLLMLIYGKEECLILTVGTVRLLTNRKAILNRRFVYFFLLRNYLPVV